MTVQELVDQLQLKVYTAGRPQQEVTGGYAADLLSCTMAKAQPGNVWVTLQAHPNVVAVASMLELAAVIVTQDVRPDEDTMERAREKRIALLGTPDATFTTVAKLSAQGVVGVN